MKIRGVAFFLALAILGVGGLLTRGEAQEGDEYTFALRVLEDGLYDIAVDGFHAYLEDHPSGNRRAEARFFLAEAYHARGFSAEAAKHYRRFLQEYPSHAFSPTARYKIGRVELEFDNLKEAASSLQEATFGPLAEPALYYLGQARFRLNDWDGAIVVLTRLVNEFPESQLLSPARYALGMAHYKKGENEKALPLLEAYLETDPEGATRLWAEAVVGEAKRQRGACSEARTAFSSILAVGDPGFPGRDGARLGLADCFYQTRGYEDAAKEYGEFLKEYPGHAERPIALFRTGHSLLEIGQPDEALPHLKDLSNEEPAPQYQPWVQFWIAEAEMALGRKEEALSAYEGLIRDFPEAGLVKDALQKAASIRFEAQDYEEAILHLVRLKTLAETEQLAWANYHLGESYYALKKYPEAFSELSEALARLTDPKRRRKTVLKMGASAFHTDRDEEAERYLSEWMRGDGDPEVRRDALKMLGAVRSRLGKLTEAAETYAALEAEFPKDPDRGETLVQLGIVQYGKEDYQGAAETLGRWTREFSREGPRADVLLHLGLAQFRLGNYGVSARRLEDFLELFPQEKGRREALFVAGMAHFQQQDFRGSVQRFQEWLDDSQGEDDVKEGLFYLATAQFKAEDYEQATSLYRQLLSRYPEDPRSKTVLYNLGLAHERLGDSERALEIFGQLAKRYPQDPDIGPILLRLAQDRQEKQDFEGALALFENATATHDLAVSAEAYYRIANIYIAHGQGEDALAVLARIPRDSTEGAPWRPAADYLTGAAYESLEKWPQALQAYREVARTSPDATTVRAALDRIAKIQALQWQQ